MLYMHDGVYIQNSNSIPRECGHNSTGIYILGTCHYLTLHNEQLRMEMPLSAMVHCSLQKNHYLPLTNENLSI